MSSEQAILHSVTPMIPTGGSLGDSLKFYTEQMGFSVLWEAGRMAGIRRGRFPSCWSRTTIVSGSKMPASVSECLTWMRSIKNTGAYPRR
jgi:hypothetical protein